MHHQSLTVKVVRCERSQIYPHNRRNSIHDALYVTFIPEKHYML